MKKLDVHRAECAEGSGNEAITTQNPAGNAAQQDRTPTASALPRLAFTMRETAQVLGVSYITVWRLLKRGKLHASDAIRNKVIPRAEIERFLRDTLGDAD